jgi:hypothetical protein
VNAACGFGGPCGIPDFQAPVNIRADQVVIDNVRLPYQKPQGSPQKRPMVVTSKPANGTWPGTRLFYSDASCGGKSVFVRQLRGPHLSTWP